MSNEQPVGSAFIEGETCARDRCRRTLPEFNGRGGITIAVNDQNWPIDGG